MKLRWLVAAIADLRAIKAYIAEENPDAGALKAPESNYFASREKTRLWCLSFLQNQLNVAWPARHAAPYPG